MTPDEFVYPDPNDKSAFVFDWTEWLEGAEIASQTVTVSGSDAVATVDSTGLIATNTKVRARLNNGTLGVTYRLTCQVVTNETPARTKEASIYATVTDN